MWKSSIDIAEAQGSGFLRSLRSAERFRESAMSRVASGEHALLQIERVAGLRHALRPAVFARPPPGRLAVCRALHAADAAEFVPVTVCFGPIGPRSDEEKFVRRISAMLLCLLIAASAGAAETIRYLAIFDGGKFVGGHQWVTRDGDRFRVDFAYKDNGRGPELKEEFTLGRDATITRYRITGVSTFGNPVNETFERNGDKTRWKSTSDKGEQVVSGSALYWPISGTPAIYSVALAALAGSPGGKVALVPNGALSMQKLQEKEIGSGNRKRTVQLVALTGVGFTPTTLWATNDASPRLVAFIIPGFFRLIEEGWESSGEALETAQGAAEKDLLAGLNRRLGHPLPGTTLIRNARVFDSERALLRPPADVLLDEGRIAAISAAGAETRTADRVIDAAGRVMLPGLFDMHAHFTAWDGGLHLAAGITTIRDMGNNNDTLLQVMAQERAGELLAPRIVAAGFIEGASPNASQGGFVIKDLEGAKKAVDWYHEHGYPQIKIYNSFPRDIVPAITEYAHARGMRVSGHIPAFMRAEQAVLGGYDEIQHINQVLLNFLVNDKTDTRTLERFYLPAEKVGTLDFDGKAVQDFIALLAQRRIVVDPTLATFNFVRQRDGVLSQEFAAVADHVPPDVRRAFYSGSMKIPDDATAARYEKSYAKMIEFVGRMYRAGIPLVAGTDDIPGFTLQRELELYVEAGLSPAQVLQIATWNGAMYARVLDDRGVIAPGKRADLILVDGDPTQNISDIRRVALVIKGDSAYSPAEVHEAIGVKPFTPGITLQ